MMNRDELPRFRFVDMKLAIVVFFLFFMMFAFFAREHFTPAVQFLFQYFHSIFSESKPNYPEASLEVEALLFFSKTAAAFLTGLTLLAIFGVFFTPAIGFANIMDKLVVEKREQLRVLNDHIKLQKQSFSEYEKIQTRYEEFLGKVDLHQRSQVAVIGKTDHAIQELNLNIMGLHKNARDLSGEVNRLEIATIALKEKTTPSGHTDKSDF